MLEIARITGRASAQINRVHCRKMGEKKKCSSFKEKSYNPESGEEGAP